MKLMIDFEPKAGFTQSEVPEAYKILKPFLCIRYCQSLLTLIKPLNMEIGYLVQGLVAKVKDAVVNGCFG